MFYDAHVQGSQQFINADEMKVREITTQLTRFCTSKWALFQLRADYKHDTCMYCSVHYRCNTFSDTDFTAV